MIFYQPWLDQDLRLARENLNKPALGFNCGALAASPSLHSSSNDYDFFQVCRQRTP